jgi:hypothetical protein
MGSTRKQRRNRKIEACKLRPTDILLVHTRHSFWGWLIRFGTHCYWNHALMVCWVGEREQDYDNILAVDAKTDGSIVISRISEYLKRPDKYDVAVKRLTADWFDNNSQSLALDLRSCICRTALNEVQFTLGMRLKNITNQVVRQFTVIWRYLRRKINKAYKHPGLPWNTRPAQVKAFTCGGFVQWCYYMAVSKTIEGKDKNQDRLRDVIFNPRIEGEPTPFGLLTTTPADLANCDKLSWEYVIKNGVIRQVSNSDDVMLAVSTS